MGLEQTLTRGVISGTDRLLSESPLNLMLPLIQTDAAINPGELRWAVGESLRRGRA